MKFQQLRGVLTAVILCLGAGTAMAAEGKPTAVTSPMGIGLGRFQSHTWGMVGTTIENPTEQAVELLWVLSAVDAPDVQFGRQVWLPARSRLRTWTLMQPPQIRPDAKSLEMRAHLIDRRGDREVALASEPVNLVVENRLLRTACVVDNENGDYAIDMVVAIRQALGGDEKVSLMRPQMLPPIEAAYAGLDQLVLGRGNLALDAAQVRALQRWLVEGGRLWVMLDVTDARLAEAIVGPAWNLTVVDRTELNQIRMEGPGADKPDKSVMELDQPERMARVVGTGWTVLHRLDGWPASLSKRVGRGVVVVTTIGPRAWASDRNRYTEQLISVARPFAPARGSEFGASVRWGGYLREQIGYRIIDRGVVAGLTFGFCVVLLAVGLVLWKFNRLEHIGYLGAAGAAGVAVVIVLIGAIQRSATPATVVSGAVVELVPEQGMALSQGEVEIYIPAGGKGSLGATDGGVVWPETGDTVGRIVRYVGQDLSRWEWENIEFPAGGVRQASFQRVQAVTAMPTATLSFGESGAVVRMNNTLGLTDMVLATSAGRFIPAAQGESQWLAGPAQVPARGQYVAAALASAEQQRRQTIYRLLLNRANQPAQPMLLGWTQALPTDLKLSAEAARTEVSLVAIPLQLEAPAAGTRVLVPAGFIPFQFQRDSGVAGGRGRTGGLARLTTIYDAERGQWIEPTQGGVAEILFSPPAQTLPLRVQKLELNLDLLAPDRTIKVGVVRGGKVEELGTRAAPMGRMSFTLEPGTSDMTVASPGIVIRLEVSDPPGGAQSSWQVRGIGMELRGVIGK